MNNQIVMMLSAKNFGLAAGILVSLTLFGSVWHANLQSKGMNF